MQLWCGIDWAKNHHDVSIVEEGGTQRVRLRIDDTVAGFTQLMNMLAEQQSLSSEPITVAIETSKGIAAGRVARRRRAGGGDQPTRGLPVSRSAFTQPKQERRRRRLRAGQHSAHRPAQPPVVTG